MSNSTFLSFFHFSQSRHRCHHFQLFASCHRRIDYLRRKATWNWKSSDDSRKLLCHSLSFKAFGVQGSIQWKLNATTMGVPRWWQWGHLPPLDFKMWVFLRKCFSFWGCFGGFSRVLPPLKDPSKFAPFKKMFCGRPWSLRIMNAEPKFFPFMVFNYKMWPLN